MLKTLLISFSVFISISLCAQDLNVLDFGAVPDGVTPNTKVIQKAVDQMSEQGGGRVVFPEGRFLTGAIQLKSNVELHLEDGALLLGSTQPDDYFKLNRWKALIIADSETNIAITGHGVIDGQGRDIALHLDSLFYAGALDSSDYNLVEMRPKYYLRPQLIEFVRCQNIRVKSVTLRNAACWVQTHHECQNILIDSVRTESDAYWNNDGIDIQDCQNVRITNCFVNSADDGICLKSHTDSLSCDQIYIANCTVRSSASAIKFGTRSHGGFRNVVIENIKVFDTFRSAVAIECVDGGVLDGVRIENVQATNTGNALFIRLGKRHTNTTGQLKNVIIKNMDVQVAFERPDYAYEIRGPALPFFHNTFPSSITGIPGHPVENVILENIKISYPGRGNNGLANLPIERLDDIPELESAYPEFSMFGELPAWGFYVRHVDGLQMKNVQIIADFPDYRPAMVFDDVARLNMHETQIIGDRKINQIILKDSPEAIIDLQQNVMKIEE